MTATKSSYIANGIDKVLNYCKKNTFLNFLENNESWLVKAGLLFIYLIIPVISIIIGIEYKIDGWSVFGFILGCMLLGYIAEKTLAYVKPTILQSPTKIGNGSLFDILAIVLGLSGLIILCFCLYSLIAHAEIGIGIVGLLIFWICEYALALLLSPKKNLNVEATETATPAETFLGITSFMIKAVYRLIPVVFGSTMILTAISIVILASDSYIELGDFYTPISILCIGALLPLFGYLTFLSYYFIIDICNAFLKMSHSIINKDKAKK